MLLCQFNSHDETLEQAQNSMKDAASPYDLSDLLELFKVLAESDPKPRSLLWWIQAARNKPMRIHPWIDQYLNARKLVGSPVVEPDPPAGTAPEPTAQAEPVPDDAGGAADAATVAPSDATGTGSANEQKSWFDIALPYIVAMLKSKQFGTAKELFHALEADADSPTSPFSKGVGSRRGELHLLTLPSENVSLAE